MYRIPVRRCTKLAFRRPGSEPEQGFWSSVVSPFSKDETFARLTLAKAGGWQQSGSNSQPGRRTGIVGCTCAPARRISYLSAMRSFTKVFCLSLLSVALLAGSAQARTVKGCVIKAKTSCAGTNLSGQNLRGVNLDHANLRGANLSKADLRGANLSHANLRKANLKGAKLGPKPTAKKKGARASQTPACAPNCQGADLSYADLSFASLSYANLSYANLSSANLTNANLSHASLTYADLDGATLAYANLTYANLDGATLYGATLYGATLTYATLTNATLTNATLTYATLTGTYFYNTICQNGMLTLPSTNTAGVLATCPAY